MEGANSLFKLLFATHLKKNSVMLLGQYKNLDYIRYRHNIM